MSNQEQDTRTIWEKQAELKEWHEREYKKEYPNSVFYTGRSLVEKRGKKWEDLTPEQQEHKECLAYQFNCMMMSLGVNISDNFREGTDATHH